MKKIARNKIEMEKLKNPLKMNGIIFDAAADTLSHFCMFSWRRSQEKYQNLIFMVFNFCRIKLNETIWFCGEMWRNNEKNLLRPRVKCFIVASFIFGRFGFINVRIVCSKPINYSKAFRRCCWYSLANNVLFWLTISLPTHIFGPHWTSFGCVMESRRRHQPVPLCSIAIPNFVPWWSGLMNNEWLQLTFKFIPSLLQGFPLFTAIQKGLKLTFHFTTSNDMQILIQNGLKTAASWNEVAD